PDGLRRLWPPRREPRDQDGGASGEIDGRVDRRVPPPVPLLGNLDRLEPRVRDARARLLPLDPVDIPEALRARPRLPQAGAGQVVPERPDRACQRAGRRRSLRALRDTRGLQATGTVVFQDHRLRGPAAGGLQAPRVLAGASDHDAAQLDRPFGGSRGRLQVRGAGYRVPGLYYAARHAVRRDVLRARAGAFRPRAP